MTDHRPRTRLFVETPLEKGQPVGVAATQAHYLRSVLRLRAGDCVALFNGRDGEWLARLDGLGKGWASLVPCDRRRVQTPPPDLWLCFAPVKRLRIDLVAEKATELGVAVLQPVLTRHTDVSRVNLDRLRANAIEAAEQCGRLDVPDVRPPVSLADLVAAWPPHRLLIVAVEAGEAEPLTVVAARSEGRMAALLIGPEGGFAATELDAFADLPFVSRVGLGPRVLRADTAAIAAIACWQCLAGDWSSRPPDGADRP